MPSSLHLLTSNEPRTEHIGDLLDLLLEPNPSFTFYALRQGTGNCKSIRQTIEWGLKRSSKREHVRFELYLNTTKRDKTLAKLKSIDKKIRAKFKHDDSGIYLITNHFLHTKAYQIEGKNNGVLSIGSNNLTERAIKSNEEALLSVSYEPLYAQQ